MKANIKKKKKNLQR